MQHSPRFLQLCEAVRGRITEITADELSAKLAAAFNSGAAKPPPPFYLLDVREDHEWQAGRIPEAQHLGRGILERDIEKLIPDLDAPIILYCGGGYRSALAAESLQQMGYRRVYSLAGGFRGWKDAGRPILTAPLG